MSCNFDYCSMLGCFSHALFMYFSPLFCFDFGFFDEIHIHLVHFYQFIVFLDCFLEIVVLHVILEFPYFIEIPFEMRFVCYPSIVSLFKTSIVILA